MRATSFPFALVLRSTQAIVHFDKAMKTYLN